MEWNTGRDLKQSYKGMVEEFHKEFHKALSHKPMASETVPVTVLPPVSVWWTKLSYVFFLRIKIKNPLIPPKNVKKDISWENNVFYQFCIKNEKRVSKNKKMQYYPKRIEPWTIDTSFYRFINLATNR